MRDLIERQAAIDEIKNFKNGAEEWRNEQEELSPIWHRADSAFASAIEIGLRIKKLPSAPRWIPVSERLPEKMGWYIVTTDKLDVMEMWYPNSGCAWELPCDKVIAWMPLPGPWKGGEDEALCD